jgi:hypothetical protein
MRKYLLVIYFLFSSVKLMATDLMRFPVYDMGPYQNFELMFRLYTAPRFGHVILDCQSFMHQIQFTEPNKEDVIFKFYLDPNECQDIYEYIENSLEKSSHICIELNSYSGEFLLSREYKDCY